MSDQLFDVLSPDAAPADAKPILERAKEKFKMVPNLYGIMANAPASLKAYGGIMGNFEEGSFDVTERQVIMQTINVLNECHYCVAAHTAAAGAQGVPGHVIDAIREGRPIADERLEALRQFTVKMVEKRGWVDAADINAFIGAGFKKEQILDVIVGVAAKTLSNYINHVADTPLDAPFQKFALKKAI